MQRSAYIVNPWFDWTFFLLPPALAFALAWWLSGSWFADEVITVWGEEITPAGFAVRVIIHAHLVAVLLRSHANRSIRQRHPWRFLLLPPLLYVAILWSPWVLISVSVLATFWDVYHSGLQTFGFARIYDARQGNHAQVGRRLDWWLNLLFYAGPIVAGATLIDHIEDFESFEDVGSAFFTAIPAAVLDQQVWLTQAIIGAGTVFALYYVLRYWRLARAGYRVSPLKVYLLLSTGACSIYAWGFNPWGEAFFIMNLFHAVQYLALVWHMEGRDLWARTGLAGLRGGRGLGVGVYVAVLLGYGVWVQSIDTDITSLWAITLVVSILHFWYDGFVWSVRRQEV